MLTKMNGDLTHLQAAALGAVADAVVITDRDGTIEWVNPAFTRLSGYRPDEAVGRTPRLLRSGANPDGLYESLWSTVLAGRVWRGELVERHRDGHLYTVAQTIIPLVDDSGQVTHFVAVHEDVSALRDSQARLHALFEHAADAIFLADDHGRYIDVNPAACSLTGYTREQLLTMGPADLVAPDRTAQSVVEQFDAFVSDGEESGEFPMQHRTGRVIETEYRAVANIQPGVHLSIVRDVTERNASIRALQASERQFRGLADNAGDIVTILHVDEQLDVWIDHVNPAVRRLFGLPVLTGPLGDPPLTGLCHPDDTATLERLLRTDGDAPVRGMVRFPDAAGQWVWLEATVTATGRAPTHRTLQIIARDATGRQQTRAALEAALRDQQEAAQALQSLNHTKQRLLQNISHELRTPLTVVLGFAEVLARRPPGDETDELRDYHERILRNARRMQRIVDDLAILDDADRARRTLRRSSVDLADLVNATATAVDLGDRTVTVDLTPVRVSVDPAMVRRIVKALLDNIVAHTPLGTHVTIGVQPSPHGAHLTVEDDGPGIDPQVADRLLEPFAQGEHTDDAAQPGIGLGLALIDVFTRAHGGRLCIGQRPGGGTRIDVHLADGTQDITRAQPTHESVTCHSRLRSGGTVGAPAPGNSGEAVL